MKSTNMTILLAALFALTACGGDQAEDSGAGETDPAAAAGTNAATGEATEIAPGLTAQVLREGSGKTAEAGNIAVVHYTGWLYDPSAADNRGRKFDSSVDRGQHFRFPLGAGRVIPGWDQGVVGMQVGEVRELTIAPEMAYGDRGAGDVIPPGSTLVFEVELAGIESPADGG